MDKKAQERMTNRIMLTMAISFVICIAMYYIYGAIGNNIFTPAPTFITTAVIFVLCAGIMMILGVKEGKKFNLGMAEGYKKNLKARLFYNFEIFFLISAVLSLGVNFGGKLWQNKLIKAGASHTTASGYAKVMIVLAVLILVYNIALIAGTFIYEAREEKKIKMARQSKKATAKAAIKEKRSKM